MQEQGTLFLVPTPIGNLADITLRALETLKSVSLIAAEDTRKTGILLKHYEIKTKQISYHKYNEKSRTKELVERMQRGEDIAVVTDAGTPGISDPAKYIVDAALAAGLKVSSLPGATALIPALTASGLDSSAFCFYGFLPMVRSKRQEILTQIKVSKISTILYETCPKLMSTLSEILQECGNRPICIAREISKVFEEYIRGDLKDICKSGDITLKGELVLILGKTYENEDEISVNPDESIHQALVSGEKPKEILVKVMKEFGLSKNDAYNRILDIKKRKKSEQ